MDTAKQYLSKEKYKELEKELEYLKGEKRQEITKNIEYAKALGDLSENAEYHEAREQQAALEDKILATEHMLKSAEIVSSKGKSDIASVGSTIILKKEDGISKTYEIVGSAEADSLSGKISNHSPIGQAVLGKKKNDRIKVVTPSGNVIYTIVDVK